MKGHIIMSKKEIRRIPVIEKVIDKRINQKEGAKELKISDRQLRRIIKKYKQKGSLSLVHKLRGKPSPNKLSLAKETIIIEIVKKHYHDFGPTFANEKLFENHGIKISNEKLRQIMIQENIWILKKRKLERTHQMRARRSREGELVQIDGSPHAWFEERGEKCCLLVYIDDATSKLKWMHFCESETTNNYFKITKIYIEKYGLPLALYSDKHGIFRINTKELNSLTIDKNAGLTQFGRAMKELEIELINAETPQAKGRVERVNSTLQDRLVKELRLAGINTIEEANKFVPEFIEKHNNKFGVLAKNADDAHRELSSKTNLDLILQKEYERIISKNLTIQYENKIYQISTKRQVYAMMHQKVSVIEDNLGRITIIYKGNKLDYEIHKQQPKINKIISNKNLNIHMDKLLTDAFVGESKQSISNLCRI